MRVPITEIYKELDIVTDRISTQVRTITVGVLALVWVFLSGGKDMPAISLVTDKRFLLVIAAMCIVTLVVDLAQYQVGYWLTNRIRKAAERVNQTEAAYDQLDWRYRLRIWLFWAKQVLSLAAAFLLMIVLAYSVARSI
jgi:hypothetical protein